MSRFKAFYAKQYGIAPFWQKAAAGFVAGSLTGGGLHYLLADNPMIPAIAAGVSAAVFFTFGKSAAKMPLKAFTVGPEDIFAATDKAHALRLANAVTGPFPAYCIEEVEPIQAKYLNQPWGESKETLQQRLDARSEPGYFAGWQD